jgi:alpha-tubulin suppressor-like RCC1 family protein
VSGGLAFVALTAGNHHTCGLDPVGQAYCWGYNYYSQLGDDSNQSRTEPVPVMGELNFVALQAGGYHTCGLTHDGQMHCWGYNTYGQLGDGSGSNQPVPVAVDQGDREFTELVAGNYHTCGATENGSVYCWGYNNYGQIGDGTEENRLTPTPVSSLGNMVGVAAGRYHTCAWSEFGNGYCWGRGFLGTGEWTVSSLPLQVDGSHDFARMAAGDFNTCGITDTDQLYCWGYSDYGQQGTGVYSNTAVPTLVPDVSPVADVDLGYHHLCSRSVSGQLSCWGEEGYGQVGNGEVSYRTIPTAVGGGVSGFSRISTGFEHACGLLDSGEAYCWGRGDSGQLGDGMYGSSTLPVEVMTSASFQEVSSGSFHSCALTPAGEAYCWGGGSTGRLGTGSTASESTPAPVSGGHAFQDLRAGYYHTCGVTSAGQVLCWGSNGDGQLGDGVSSYSAVPIPPALPPGRVFSGAGTGIYHSCALTESGEVWCWGYNYYGQLGDETFDDRMTPVQVTGLPSDMTALAVGGFHGCGLDGSGKAWCWGRNYEGQLGGSFGSFVATAQEVPGDQVFESLFATYYGTCGLTGAGEVFCWGQNSRGQLGVGDLGYYSGPQEVAGDRQWVMVGDGFGYNHTCGVTVSGDAYCWGWQRRGALGNGRWGVQLYPVPVGTGLSFGPPVLESPGQGSAGRRAGMRSGLRFPSLLRSGGRTSGTAPQLFRIQGESPPLFQILPPEPPAECFENVLRPEIADRCREMSEPGRTDPPAVRDPGGGR